MVLVHNLRYLELSFFPSRFQAAPRVIPSVQVQDPSPQIEDLLRCTPNQLLEIPSANSLDLQFRNPLLTSTHLLELTLICY